MPDTKPTRHDRFDANVPGSADRHPGGYIAHDCARRHESGNAMTAVEAAAGARLVYVSDATTGIRRIRRGSRFSYVGSDNRAVRDPEVLLRISSRLL